MRMIIIIFCSFELLIGAHTTIQPHFTQILLPTTTNLLLWVGREFGDSYKLLLCYVLFCSVIFCFICFFLWPLPTSFKSAQHSFEYRSINKGFKVRILTCWVYWSTIMPHKAHSSTNTHPNTKNIYTKPCIGLAIHIFLYFFGSVFFLGWVHVRICHRNRVKNEL